MRLLYLVEYDHTIRSPSNHLGQLTTSALLALYTLLVISDLLFVSHKPSSRTNQPRHRVLIMKLRHV
jgi:hypothetical protein